MRNEVPFQRFALRLTLSYVMLALALVVFVGVSTTTVTFVLYSGSINESVDAATQHGLQRIAYYQKLRRSLDVFGPEVVREIARPRLAVQIQEGDRVIAQSVGRRADRGRRVPLMTAPYLGMRPKITRFGANGVLVVAPDFEGFARGVLFYWRIIVPVAIVAVFAAWMIGRRITRRALAPLADVTRALETIAEGDFTPESLRERETDLRDLTRAYNDVAYRLRVATAEQRRNETQMRQFIADAGHELRTPLTIVMGYVDALQQGAVRDGDGVARAYGTMLAEGRRMKTTIEKLILLARLEREYAPNGKRIDLASIAERAIDALRPLAGDRMHFVRNGSATVLGDDTELYEAIKNIIENAVHYAPESSIDIALQANGGRASVIVTDHGPGMDATDIEHAFDRFYRGSARTLAEGSGLGLAIAKRAAERFGGTIELHSTPGQGTNVTLSFPAT